MVVVDLVSADDSVRAAVAAPGEAAAASPTGNKGKLSNTIKRGPGRPRKKPKIILFSPPNDAIVEWSRNKICFEILGTPRAKKRAAYGTRGHRYNASQAEEQQFAATVKSVLSDSTGSVPTFDSSALLCMDVGFVFPAGKKLLATADVDNLCKFVMDALNGVLYSDDKQIVELRAKKSVAESSKLSACIQVKLSLVGPAL